MSRFEDSLTRELGHRRKEISELYLLVQSTNSESAQKHLLRGLLLLIYAHWEGFIKSSSQKYLQALQKKKIPCNQLQPALRAFYLYSQYKTQQGYTASITLSGPYCLIKKVNYENKALTDLT